MAQPSLSLTTPIAAFNKAAGTSIHDIHAALNMSADDLAYNKLAVGQSFEVKVGRFKYGFMVVQARASALAAGQLVMPYLGGAARLGNLTGTSTKAVVVTDDTLVGDLTGGLVFITAGTAIGEMRTILANSNAAGASTITVAKVEGVLPGETAITMVDAFDALPDATSDYTTFVPYEVMVCGANGFAVGVALGAVTENNYTIIQTYGPALVLAVGSTDALTAGGHIIPGAAGVVKGPAAAGTGIEGAAACGFSFAAYSGASQLWGVFLTCKF